jgi:hypothetical protein
MKARTPSRSSNPCTPQSNAHAGTKQGISSSRRSRWLTNARPVASFDFEQLPTTAVDGSAMKTLLLAASITSLTFACAAGGSSSSSTASLLDQCTGTYQCVGGAGVIGTPYLHKDGDACMLNSNVTLSSDGTVLIDNNPTNQTWSGDSQSFQWCESNGCSTCTVIAAPKADAVSAGGKCTGSTYGCEEQDPPYCSDVSGCYMATRIGPNNSFDNYCTGYPDSCSEMDTESSCKKQGCTWQP